MATKEMELKQLHELNDSFCEIYELEKKIEKEREKIELLKENVKDHDIKRPESEAEKARANIYRPFYRRVYKMANILFVIYLIVGIGIILLSGYSISQESSTMMGEVALLLVVVSVSEIPFIAALIIFGIFIKKTDAEIYTAYQYSKLMVRTTKKR